MPHLDDLPIYLGNESLDKKQRGNNCSNCFAVESRADYATDGKLAPPKGDPLWPFPISNFCKLVLNG